MCAIFWARGKDPRDEAAVLEQAELTYQNYLTKTRAAVDAVKPGLPLFHNGGHITRGRRDLAFANTYLELESLRRAAGATTTFRSQHATYRGWDYRF